MNDFFARLAAQALGLSPIIEPLIGSRFAPEHAEPDELLPDLAMDESIVPPPHHLDSLDGESAVSAQIPPLALSPLAKLDDDRDRRTALEEQPQHSPLTERVTRSDAGAATAQADSAPQNATPHPDQRPSSPIQSEPLQGTASIPTERFESQAEAESQPEDTHFPIGSVQTRRSDPPNSLTIPSLPEQARDTDRLPTVGANRESDQKSPAPARKLETRPAIPPSFDPRRDVDRLPTVGMNQGSDQEPTFTARRSETWPAIPPVFDQPDDEAVIPPQFTAPRRDDPAREIEQGSQTRFLPQTTPTETPNRAQESLSAPARPASPVHEEHSAPASTDSLWDEKPRDQTPETHVNSPPRRVTARPLTASTPEDETQAAQATEFVPARGRISPVPDLPDDVLSRPEAPHPSQSAFSPAPRERRDVTPKPSEASKAARPEASSLSYPQQADAASALAAPPANRREVSAQHDFPRSDRPAFDDDQTPEAAKNTAQQPLARSGDTRFQSVSRADASPISTLTRNESTPAAAPQPENQSASPRQHSEPVGSPFSRPPTERSRPTQATPRDAPGSEREAKAETPPIVRIRIGRVEVRAAKAKTSPPPPKREPGAGVAHRSQSLSDYLRKREAGDDE